ncbi:MAG: response regulator [Candidatus Marinimicrobia bacterium]|nr:response regulator [Candidatus Neomarinimicrobiota bacterium]MCF7880528.1 response regulator [Candidatus Neomarinimicrobiota bacterium]
MPIEIMLVEDNVMNSRLTQKVLESAGITVHLYDSAEAALEVLQKVHPQLILLDLQLPGISGYDFARQVRRIDGFQSTPLVAISANVREEDKTKAREAGCDGFIGKPINTRTLASDIKQYLE